MDVGVVGSSKDEAVGHVYYRECDYGEGKGKGKSLKLQAPSRVSFVLHFPTFPRILFFFFLFFLHSTPGMHILHISLLITYGLRK